ncbi:MAG: hypothetical protein K0B10_02065 [Vicingaceae bacterium]|nr:hypothetical protein [Vicingaceae bacterium]
MKISFFVSIVLFVFFSSQLSAQEKMDKQHFYNIISSENLELIDAEIIKMNAASKSTFNPYKGALLMKKAGLEKNPTEKLKFFKEGKLLLETAINNDNQNVELRFLRLIIQENAPKFLGYHSNIKEDVNFIQENSNKLSTVLKNILLDYSETSKELKLNE